MKNPFMKEEQKSYFYNDPFDWMRSGVRYHTVMVIASVIAGIIMLGLVVTAVLTIMGSASNAQSTDTYTTDTTVVNEYVEETTTTTVPTPTAQYVCDMPVSYGTEYTFIQWTTGEDAYVEFPSVSAHTIVFTWNVNFSQEMRNTFAKNIAEVGIYVGKEMRIEDAGYKAADGELIVPIINGSKVKQFDGVNYSAAIWTTSNMFFGTEHSFVVNDNHANLEQMIQQYGKQIIFHELGHLFGLDHTHIDGDGVDQVDSIMSYEHVWDADGFEDGDIAGLQKVFCNK